MGRRTKRAKVNHSSSQLTELSELSVSSEGAPSVLSFPSDFPTEVWLEVHFHPSIILSFHQASLQVLEKVELWDLFSLYWTSKALRALLKRPMCNNAWEDALQRLHNIYLPPLTEPRGRDLALLLLHPSCQVRSISPTQDMAHT
jgi:hypothetical protein